MTALRKPVRFSSIIRSSDQLALKSAKAQGLLIIERWLALYRQMEGGVQVVRIIEGTRDLTKIEWTP
jgi:hypothetical protein